MSTDTLRHPSHEPSFRASSAQLGLVVLLSSLGALFLAAIAAHLISRVGQPRYSQLLPLAWTLMGGALLVSAISLAQIRALRAVQRNAFHSLKRNLQLALAFAVLFLLVQAWGWRVLASRIDFSSPSALAAMTFYLLTGLHAAHVVGGLVPLGLVTLRASRGRYSSSSYEGVKLCAQYWHFLSAVWAVLAIVLVAV